MSEWIGTLPKHWLVKKIGFLFETISSGTTPATEDRSYYDGNIPWITTSELRETLITEANVHLTAKAFSDHSALKMYPKGTVLMAMYGATIGRLGILDIAAASNQACCAMASPREANAKFVYYCLLAGRPFLIEQASGGGQPNINQEKIRAFRIPCPPLPEQRAIADFLDRETTKIDALIAKQEELIQRIDERRSALIKQAVTRGVSDDAAGDCGVRNLLTLRLKHIADIRSSNVDKLSSDGQEKVRLCNYVDVYKNDHITSNILLMDSTATISQINRFGLIEDDVIITRDSENPADIAVPALVDRSATGVVCGYHLAILRPLNRRALGRFLFWALKSKEVASQFSSLAQGITRFGLTIGAIGEVIIPAPPLDEQRAIADFLDRETAKIDEFKSTQRAFITVLKERRSALITAAVTGQIEITTDIANEVAA